MQKTVKRLVTVVVLVLGVATVVLLRAESSSQGPESEKQVSPAEKVSSEPVKRSAPSRAPAVPPATPPPTIPPSTAVRTASPQAKPSTPATPLTESGLMARLREIKSKNPSLAIELAREGNRRFPDSADAPERHAILIHALADAERRSEVRGEAEYMVNHYPDSDWVRDIERFTGAHRHRNIRLNDAGQLEYY